MASAAPNPDDSADAAALAMNGAPAGPDAGADHTIGAIGVFDSGVGGLSVLRAVRQRLPDEDLIYVADSGNAPYGDRDADFIDARTTAVCRFLLAQGARLIVVACNTATVVSVARLRSWCPVPVVAIEPAIKPAALATKSGVIGVLATQRTVHSASVARLVSAHGAGVDVRLQACPGLVEQVERGQLDSAATRALLAAYLSPLLAAGVDTLVLGCTHYPFLAPLIRDIVGPDVAIVDPAAAVAREAARRLGELRAPPVRRHAASTRFHSSAEPGPAAALISALWGQPVDVLPLAPPGQP